MYFPVWSLLISPCFTLIQYVQHALFKETNAYVLFQLGCDEPEALVQDAVLPAAGTEVL